MSVKTYKYFLSGLSYNIFRGMFYHEHLTYASDYERKEKKNILKTEYVYTTLWNSVLSAGLFPFVVLYDLNICEKLSKKIQPGDPFLFSSRYEFNIKK